MTEGAESMKADRTVVSGAPQEMTVRAGAYYSVRVIGADVTVQELLDEDYEDLSENGTIADGATVRLYFSSDKIRFTVAAGSARLWVHKLKVGNN